MAKFREVQKTDDKPFKCDHCKDTFLLKDVKLSDPADNISILTPGMCFLYVDKEGNIVGGGDQPNKKRGDRLFACPLCAGIHLFGFNRA